MPRQMRLLRQQTRTSAVWRVTVLGAIAGLVLAAFDLCTTPQELGETFLAFLVLPVISVGWFLLVRLIRVRPTPPALWSEVRINELHPQGAVCRGESGTVVLPYDEVTLYEETEDWLILSGSEGMILWSANDLTPPAATSIQLYLRAKVPIAAMQIKDTFRARGERLLPLPTLPPRAACLAKATAETRPRKRARLRCARALMRGAPLMFLLAMSIGVLLHRLFQFDAAALNSPLTWFAGLSLLQLAALYGLYWWDARADRKNPYSTPEFLFCEDGMWVTTGRGAERFLRGSVPVIRLGTSLELKLPRGSVRVPYRTMCDKDLIFRYFDLTH